MLKGKEVEEWLMGSGEAVTSDNTKEEFLNGPLFSMMFAKNEITEEIQSDLKSKHDIQGEDDWMFKMVLKPKPENFEKNDYIKVATDEDFGLSSFINFMDQHPE